MHKAVKFNIGKTQELAVLQCLHSCHVGRKVEEPFVTGAHTDQWVEGNREADFNSMKGFPKSTHMYRGRQGGAEKLFGTLSSVRSCVAHEPAGKSMRVECKLGLLTLEMEVSQAHMEMEMEEGLDNGRETVRQARDRTHVVETD